MTQPLYIHPSLQQENDLLDIAFPQNLPSILVSHILNPLSTDVVLDMCAGPGGKLTHLATLMNDKVIAI